MPYLDIEMKRECNRKYMAKNRDKDREAQRRYRKSQKAKDTKRAYYARNREIILEKKKVWRKANWDKEVAMRIKGKFKISVEDFNRMRAEQDNKCPVCTREFSGDVFPNIDHCHETGIVRGLLCTSCNYAEGFLRNPDNARRMYEYMVKHGLCYNKKAEGY